MSIPLSSDINQSSKLNSNNHRVINKAEKELRYQSLFAPYIPLQDYSIYFINYGTTENELDFIMDVVQRSYQFFIDTESDYMTNLPALIQISFMNPDNKTSIVILIEIQFLPAVSSLRFTQIQKFFHLVFRGDTYLYVWGKILDELKPFLNYKMFTFPIYSFIQNTQSLFAQWFNDWINLHSSVIDCSSDYTDDTLIIHAPQLDPQLFIPPAIMNEIKLSKNELWSLQDGIVYIFNQYLSKQQTLQKWSKGLDLRLKNNTKSINKIHHEQLITYAVYDCMSLEQLVRFMHKSNISSAFTYRKYDRVSGKYLLFIDEPAITYISQDNSTDLLVNSTASVECSWTGHELNDRPLTPVEIHSTMDPDHLNNVNNVIINKTRVRHKRSLAAKQRRNKKSSQRHRKTRYSHEIIRMVNTNIETVKQILKQHQVKYVNTNIVRSKLYIGLKNQQLQDKYEQLLPMDLFV